VQFALNGIMFVLLGEQLPAIFASAVQVVQESNHVNPWWLAVYVLTINFGLAALRFGWVWLSMKGAALVTRRRGAAPHEPTPRLVAAISVAGVRGAITLAGVLTLPLVLADGAPFPARDLAIFLAAGVIILSLTAANLTLPRLLAGLAAPSEHDGDAELDEARHAAAEAAIRAVEEALHEMARGHSDADFYAEAAARVMDRYRRRVEGHATGENAARVRHIDRIERRLRLAGLRAERDTIFALARAQRISDASSRKLVREIDLVEERFR
jgi:CPA1 family monovalent cation:H+ antiporter